jgi:hypothetical protein
LNKNPHNKPSAFPTKEAILAFIGTRSGKIGAREIASGNVNAGVQRMYDGACQAAMGMGQAYEFADKVNGIIYSANWDSGIWALKVK